MESGQADIHSGLFHTEERAARLAFSPPFYGAQVGVFYNPKHLHLARLQDLDGHELGVVAGSYLEQHLRANLPGARIRPYPDGDALIHAAVAGQIKAFAGETAAAANYLDRLGSGGLSCAWRVGASPSRSMPPSGRATRICHP